MPDIYDQPGSLMVQTCQLLQTADLSDLSRQTQIPYNWLCKLKTGKIANPSVNRVQFLNEYLTKGQKPYAQ